MIAVVPVDGRGKAAGQPCTLPEQQALDMIVSGKATLHRRQEEPPWALLSEAKTALLAMEQVGPPATSEVLEQISIHLLPSMDIDKAARVISNQISMEVVTP